MATTHSSSKIAQELRKLFGEQQPSVKVEMKYTREVGQFIQKVQSAHQNTAKSQQRF